ncbi:MAG: magnesium transporter [Desulfurellaceae bacterium]|nr:magnesium transporter [Desulfurellaceae bacterium]
MGKKAHPSEILMEESRTIGLLTNTTRKLVRKEAYKNLSNLLRKLHPADISSVIQNLTLDESMTVIKTIEDLDIVTQVMEDLDDYTAAEIIEQMSEDKAAHIFEKLPSDKSADIYEKLSEEKTDIILSKLSGKKQEEITKLLVYPKDTAGGIMDPDVFSVNKNLSVKEAMDVIRRMSKNKNIIYIYVVDENRHLVGVVSLRALITSDPQERIENIMMPHAISVRTEMDQEEVARLVDKYDLLAVPVTDNLNKLVGVISVDDIIDVIREETTEDMYKLAGTSGAEVSERSIWKIVKYRMPWLLVSLFGESVSGAVLHSFDNTLQQFISIAFFIPLIMALGGNTGIQSQTIIVRSIAIGKIRELGIKYIVLRQLRVAITIGIICGIMVSAIAFVTQRDIALTIAVGTSLFLSMFITTLLGVLIPVGLKKVGVDPAVSSGPFITSFNDIISLIIYLSICVAMLKIV